ncbi:unnamed protein product [Haemonchus placei]|uniref:Uncharacterized protein n=1 Tax=Haemonchus placei TaxID=6290 RepID=A0A0N4WJU9_HAEPC|nr:unnamed protein product [Haemonchus placei]
MCGTKNCPLLLEHPGNRTLKFSRYDASGNVSALRTQCCKLKVWCSSRHECTSPANHAMLEMMQTSPDDDAELLLMPAWKHVDGEEILYVIHPNRAVTREVFVDGVKQDTRYAGEFTSIDYEPWLVFVNYLPFEDTVRSFRLNYFFY